MVSVSHNSLAEERKMQIHCESFIEEAPNDQIAEVARKLVDLMLKAGMTNGVVWLEFFEHEGEGHAQVHFIDESVAEQAHDRPDVSENRPRN